MAEEFNMSRKKAAIINCALIGIVGILAAGSADGSGYFGNIKILGKGFFDLFDYLSSNLTMPIGGILIALFVGYVLKPKDFFDELTNNGMLQNHARVNFIRILLRYVTPILVMIIFLNALGILKI